MAVSLVMALAVLMPVAGPALSHHYAESSPVHSHLFLTGDTVHVHRFGSAHEHSGAAQDIVSYSDDTGLGLTGGMQIVLSHAHGPNLQGGIETLQSEGTSFHSEVIPEPPSRPPVYS